MRKLKNKKVKGMNKNDREKKGEGGGNPKKRAKKNTLEVGGDLRFHKGTLQYYRR